jgi:hypothetical protein
VPPSSAFSGAGAFSDNAHMNTTVLHAEVREEAESAHLNAE